MEIDLPEPLAEMRAAFDRYEAAINANAVAVLNELFWRSPRTLRYGASPGELKSLHAEAISLRQAARSESSPRTSA